MFSDPPILVGVELGTSKIAVAVGEENERGEFCLLGVGQARSRGVRKGEIVNISEAREDLREAVAEAEEKTQVTIRNIFLGVTGRHVIGFNHLGMHVVASDDRKIAAQDVADAQSNAKAITLPTEHTVLHTILQGIRVDGADASENPVGLHGHKVEAFIHVVHGNALRIQNSVDLVRSLSLEVNGPPVFTGLADAQAVLTPEDKREGALVIDIGGGATEFILQQGPAIRQSGVFAVGGDHVTNDIAAGLKTRLGPAERLKLEHGHALVDAACRGRSVPLGESEVGLPPRTVQLEHLRRIMSVRLRELFELIHDRCSEVGELDAARAGIFLCGGGSHIPGIDELARQVFGMPVTLAACRNMAGNEETLSHPEFVTAVGLARYGGMRLRGRPRQRFNLRDVISLFR